MKKSKRIVVQVKLDPKTKRLVDRFCRSHLTDKQKLGEQLFLAIATGIISIEDLS